MISNKRKLELNIFETFIIVHSGICFTMTSDNDFVSITSHHQDVTFARRNIKRATLNTILCILQFYMTTGNTLAYNKTYNVLGSLFSKYLVLFLKTKPNWCCTNNIGGGISVVYFSHLTV